MSQMRYELGSQIIFGVVFLALFVGYLAFVFPVYAYDGFYWEYKKQNLVVSILLHILFVFSLPKKISKPSDFFLILHYLFPIMPMLVLHAGGGEEANTELLVAVFFLFQLIKIVARQEIRFPLMALSKVDVFIFSLLSFSILILLFVLATNGFGSINFDFSKVYELRESASANLGLVNLFLPWVSKVILPYVVIATYVYRRYKTMWFSIFLCVLMFGLTTHKSILFYPFFVAGLFIMLRGANPIRKMCYAYMALILVSLVMFFWIDDVWTGSILIRRSLFVPALLNNYYYDFFSINPNLYWAESKLSFGLVKNIYQLSSTHLIGEEFFGRDTMGANTGWIGSGYMHMGYFGMTIYSLVIGLVMGYINRCSKKIDYRVLTPFVAITLITVFTSSDLTTSLLTHGLLLNMFIIYISPTIQVK